MAKTLDQKIALLVDDIRELNHQGMRDHIRAFLKSELGLLETTRYWNATDLHAIKSRAVSILNDTSPNAKMDGVGLFQDRGLLQALVYIQATLEYMRGAGLTGAWVGFRDEKSEFTLCSHPQVDRVGEKDYVCTRCRENVTPILWGRSKPKTE